MNSQEPTPIKSSTTSPVQPADGNVRQDTDPRFKSPDDTIARLAPKKAVPAIEISHPSDDRVAKLTHELFDLRSRYGEEISQWRDYERRVQEWRAQVIAIVEGLRRDTVSHQTLLQELHHCRALLKNQADELERLRRVQNSIKAAS